MKEEEIMRKRTGKALATLAAALLVFTLYMPVWAADATGFAALPILPENQKNSVGVFDLVMKPGQVQELQVVLENRTGKENRFTVEVFAASTNNYGEVEFDGPGPVDETMQYKLSDILIPSETEPVLEPMEKRTMTFTLTMPPEEFDGYILGAILFTQKASDEEIAEAVQGVTILNEYAQSIGVRLTTRDNKVPVVFEMGEVQFTTFDYKASVVSGLRNPTPNLVQGMKVENHLYEVGVSDPIISMRNEEVEMAPNSVYQIPLIDRAGYGILPGDYRSVISVEYEGETKTFEKDFSITPEQAEEVNRNAVNQTAQNREVDAPEGISLPTWAIILIVAGSLILIAALIIFLKVRSEKKNYELYMQMYYQKQKNTQ